jgi:hypothetical protein
MRVHLPSTRTYVYTASVQAERRPRMEHMLRGLGFRDWQFVEGKPGWHWKRNDFGLPPYWELMKVDMARTMRDAPTPFLWMEDDATLTPHYVPTIDVPEECDWAFLGGCCVGSAAGALAGRRVFGDARLKPMKGHDVRHLLDVGGFDYTQYLDCDEEWVRVANMYSQTAMLVMHDRMRDRLVDLLAHYPGVSDYLFSLEESHWHTLSRKREFWYQADKNCLYTLNYFRETPLRVDFAGGWLDVPQFACPQGRIVNCAVTPQVTVFDLEQCRYSGLGGSAARSILLGMNGVQAELDAGAGWQDPAVIQETGLCLWHSGPRPNLLTKLQPDELLRGRMAVRWMGSRKTGTSAILDRPRDLAGIVAAGRIAERAVRSNSFPLLCQAVEHSYRLQLDEGMPPLPTAGELAKKYCGSGHGGNALYLFPDAAARGRFLNTTPEARAVEPYLRPLH